jgi:hypothetical protein
VVGGRDNKSVSGQQRSGWDHQLRRLARLPEAGRPASRVERPDIAFSKIRALRAGLATPEKLELGRGQSRRGLEQQAFGDLCRRTKPCVRRASRNETPPRHRISKTISATRRLRGFGLPPFGVRQDAERSATKRGKENGSTSRWTSLTAPTTYRLPPTTCMREGRAC